MEISESLKAVWCKLPDESKQKFCIKMLEQDSKTMKWWWSDFGRMPGGKLTPAMLRSESLRKALQIIFKKLIETPLPLNLD